MTAFEAGTAVRRGADGGYEARLDGRWAIGRGLHGGYVAAVILRALMATVANPERHPRSLTVHFTRPAVPGEAMVLTAVERAGGSLSTLSARLVQEGRLAALALAAFATSRQGIDYSDLPLPDAPEPEDVPAYIRDFGRPTFTDNFDYRPAEGAMPFSGSKEAVTGGWIRPVEAQAADAPLVACLTDAWIPAVLQRLAEPVGPVPTIDLTIHFREELPAAGAAPGEFQYVQFVSRRGERGFWEEDGVVWSRDGRVLAQSRQLALLA